MLLELAKEGYVTTIPSPEHKRKRLVTITPLGSEIVQKGKSMIDENFDRLMLAAGVDIEHYNELTEQIYKALMDKSNKEQL